MSETDHCIWIAECDENAVYGEVKVGMGCKAGSVQDCIRKTWTHDGDQITCEMAD